MGHLCYPTGNPRKNVPRWSVTNVSAIDSNRSAHRGTRLRESARNSQRERQLGAYQIAFTKKDKPRVRFREKSLTSAALFLFPFPLLHTNSNQLKIMISKDCPLDEFFKGIRDSRKLWQSDDICRAADVIPAMKQTALLIVPIAISDK